MNVYNRIMGPLVLSSDVPDQRQSMSLSVLVLSKELTFIFLYNAKCYV